MRRLTSLLLVLALSLVSFGPLTACGKKGDLDPPPTSDEKAKKKKT